MAAAQARQPRAALSLLAVLVAAKVVALAGHPLPLSPWAPFAYVWQDVFAAIVAGAIEPVIRPRALVWALYGLIVAYVAINVPVTLILSSPLTPRLIRAAGPALGDSLRSAVTLRTAFPLAAVVAVGLTAPALFRRVLVGRRAVACAAVIALVGWVGSSRIDTRGLERNVFGALVPITKPVFAAEIAADGSADSRASPFGASSGEDSTSLHGAASGFNVLLVALESTGARYLKAYGAREDPTPNLTRLAGRGVLFENAYAVYPESIKGLLSTLCSRYPEYDAEVDADARQPCDSIAERLHARGYRTALFHSGRFAYLGMGSVVAGRGFDVLEDAGTIGGRTESSFGVDEPSTVAAMLRWLDSLAPGDRFMLTYLPIAGHHPYATFAPGPFPETTEQGRYLNAIHEGDAALGALLDGLARRGLDRRTLVVVYGDHGEAFGQHDGNAGHTLYIYDENVRVPFVIAGLDNGPARVRRPVSLIDAVPTILDLVGLPPSPSHQGTSALAPAPQMALFFTDYSLGWLGLRDGCWKYLREVRSDRSRLFDICRDPDETDDRASAEPARTAAYAQRVIGLVRNR